MSLLRKISNLLKIQMVPSWKTLTDDSWSPFLSQMHLPLHSAVLMETQGTTSAVVQAVEQCSCLLLSCPRMACCYLALLLVFLTSGTHAKLHHGELQTLLTIRRDWGSPAALSSWKPKSSVYLDHCDWDAVTCNSDGQVTTLSFTKLQIANPIPASICKLKHLSSLDLSYNNLTGEFPKVLYGCSIMQYLDLSNNQLAGSLPRDIGKLSSEMLHLNLSVNGFVGLVPSAIAGFPKLKSLVLDTNDFNGSYPAEAIGRLVELETLTLAKNPFAPGLIPDAFGKLTKLTLLWLSEMNLTGEIPRSLSALTELSILDMSMNKLQGEIPEWIWKLQKLQYLYMFANRFTGGVGPFDAAASMLQLDLSSNKLTGPIHESIGNMKNLSLLFLYYNDIAGPIPASLGLLPNLFDIRLFDNKLSGPLPPDLGKHSPLGNFEVSNNLLSGELPETLCANKQLFDLVVFGNGFSGAFPASLGECDTLDNIMAHNNSFAGYFPEKIWSFPKLTTVQIHDNSFTGTLPAKLSPLISRIEMENNRFSGAVPRAAPGLKVFWAQNNLFSGELPTDMTGLANLTDLNLSGNRITGSIPASIQLLGRLNYLVLSNNKISGPIPAGIGFLPALGILDLSNNELTGSIPPEFGNLHLNNLNLSSNQLTGEIPVSLQSPAYYQSFLDNPGLRPCARTSNNSHDHHVMIILLVVLPSITLISTAITGWLLLSRMRGRRDVTSWKMTAFRALDFTEKDIISGISEENLIGRGGSGKVYRIQFGRGKAGHGGSDDSQRTVAVKRIGNAGKADTSLEKEFESEVKTLGELRHDNIVNLLCCISGDDDKLLVYENMENGSLDHWLHRRHQKRAGVVGPLEWSTRLSIAVDVARGLSYMHEDLVRPVIHRDVKCSNVLLDCNFRAKIADFGLARILAKFGESEAASAVCGTFGYIAPEYIQRAKVSEKVDVYSFGVVLLELATGRGAQDGGTESGSCLAKWASKRYRNGGPFVGLVDDEIIDTAYLDDMVTVFELGVVCTREDPRSRPSMSEILRQLLDLKRDRDSTEGHEAKYDFG